MFNGSKGFDDVASEDSGEWALVHTSNDCTRLVDPRPRDQRKTILVTAVINQVEVVEDNRFAALSIWLS